MNKITLALNLVHGLQRGGWRGYINDLLEPIVVAISCDE